MIEAPSLDRRVSPEYAKRFVWGVDADIENGLLNINVAYDPEGDVNCGAFCSFIEKSDVKELKLFGV